MDLFHVQQEEEGGQAQISNKTQKEDHMKSINPLKMDHISLALTFLGILAACRSEIFGFGKSMSIPIDA